MPIYTFTNPKTGEKLDLHLPVERRDDGPPGWMRAEVPERVAVVGLAPGWRGDFKDCNEDTRAGFRQIEEQPGGLDRIRAEMPDMTVDEIKDVWSDDYEKRRAACA